MTVITEDMLRIKRLKKELEDGTDFVFPVGSFLDASRQKLSTRASD